VPAQRRDILKAAGSSLDRVMKVTVLLARPELYREMNEAYAEFFPGAKPARAMAASAPTFRASWSPSRRSRWNKVVQGAKHRAHAVSRRRRTVDFAALSRPYVRL
jgi:enamine deaminase RidA (YjgF/YER057c/UK114 family)